MNEEELYSAGKYDSYLDEEEERVRQSRIKNAQIEKLDQQGAMASQRPTAPAEPATAEETTDPPVISKAASKISRLVG